MTNDPSLLEHRRIKREKKTIRAMIAIYCKDHHGSGKALCSDCDNLLSYSMKRLDKCTFQQHKTTCSKCPIHCYNPSMREKVKSVMKYAGPRMTFRHPALAMFHVLDGLKKRPSKEKFK